MQLSSPAFPHGQPIPRRHTGQGADVSPALQWTEVPAGTRDFALICEDPDAPGGMWVHWVLYCIPASATGLPENVPPAERLSDGSRQGRNDFGHLGYGGPLPPPGPAHRYCFKLYALDQELRLAPGLRRAELRRALQGHILAETQLVGTYQRA